jgi:hypothetical protein
VARVRVRTSSHEKAASGSSNSFLPKGEFSMKV